MENDIAALAQRLRAAKQFDHVGKGEVGTLGIEARAFIAREGVLGWILTSRFASINVWSASGVILCDSRSRFCLLRLSQKTIRTRRTRPFRSRGRENRCWQFVLFPKRGAIQLHPCCAALTKF
jgi:hypothetical protein